MDGLAVKPLTVDFHEGGFLGKLNQESKLGFWFQLSDDEKKQAGSPWGPQNPQALNRYSYVLNNPLKWTDPAGHYTYTYTYKGLSVAQADAIVGTYQYRATVAVNAMNGLGVVGGAVAGGLCGLISGGTAAAICAVAMGGAPVAVAAAIDIESSLFNKLIQDAKEKIGPNGTMDVIIDGGYITVIGYDENGNEKYRETMLGSNTNGILKDSFKEKGIKPDIKRNPRVRR